MNHPSAYLDWYIHVPGVKYDFRSSGLAHFKYHLDLGKVDLSANFAHGNPETAELLAQRYNVKAENVFISSEGASGQNARIIRCLAERNKRKNEAIVEYPTYEPLLRQVQEYFPHVKRLERKEKDQYRLDAGSLRKAASERTGLLVITNPHAPSSAISQRGELKEMMEVAKELGFFVLCDEIYAEFDRETMPTVFSVDEEHGMVTTSFTKAYGLGGLKLGTALASEEIVDELYTDVLNTVGNSPNVVQLAAADLLENGVSSLERHKEKWIRIKRESERSLKEIGLGFFPNKISVTYWVKLPISDTHKWINKKTIPQFGLALVPGSFFLFNSNYRLEKTDMVRLGLGNLYPESSHLIEAFDTLKEALKAR